MPRERLRQLLSELRTELAATGDLDETSRAALRQLSDDIDRTVSAPADTGTEQTPLAELKDATLRLEARHPRLATLLGQIGDTLGKLGI